MSLKFLNRDNTKIYVFMLVNQEISDAFDKAIRGLEAHRLLNTSTCACIHILGGGGGGGGGGPSADVTVQAEIAGGAKPPPAPPLAPPLYGPLVP